MNCVLWEIVIYVLLATVFLIISVVIVVIHGSEVTAQDDELLAIESKNNAVTIALSPKYTAQTKPSIQTLVKSNLTVTDISEQRPPNKPPNIIDKPVKQNLYYDVSRPHHGQIQKLPLPRRYPKRPVPLQYTPNSLYKYPKFVPIPPNTHIHHSNPTYYIKKTRPVIYAPSTGSPVLGKSPKFSVPQTINGIRSEIVKPPHFFNKTSSTSTTTAATTITTTQRVLRTKRIWPKRVVNQTNMTLENTTVTEEEYFLKRRHSNKTEGTDRESSESKHRLTYTHRNSTTETTTVQPSTTRGYRPVTRKVKVKTTTPLPPINFTIGHPTDWVPMVPSHYVKSNKYPTSHVISKRSDRFPANPSESLDKQTLFLQSFGLVPVINSQDSDNDVDRRNRVKVIKRKRILKPHSSGRSRRPVRAPKVTHWHDDHQHEGHHKHKHHHRGSANSLTKVKHHHHHHHHRYIKTVEKPIKVPYKVEVPKPYAVEIEKKIPVPVEKIKVVEKRVPYKVTVEKQVPYPIGIKIPQPVPVKVVEKEYVPQPYPVFQRVPVVKHVEVKVPHPVPVQVEKKVPFPVEVRVPVPVDRPVPVAVHVEKKVPYPVPVKVFVPQPYPVEKRVPYPVEVKVKEPIEVVRHVPIKVPYPQPYAVKVPQPIPIHVEKRVPYPVEKRVHVPVEVLVPHKVEVEKRVPVYIPKPYPIEKKVPFAVKIPYPVKVPVRVPVKVPVEVPVYVHHPVQLQVYSEDQYPPPSEQYQLPSEQYPPLPEQYSSSTTPFPTASDQFSPTQGYAADIQRYISTTPAVVEIGHGNKHFNRFQSRSDNHETTTATTPSS